MSEVPKQLDEKTAIEELGHILGWFLAQKPEAERILVRFYRADDALLADYHFSRRFSSPPMTAGHSEQREQGHA